MDDLNPLTDSSSPTEARGLHPVGALSVPPLEEKNKKETFCLVRSTNNIQVQQIQQIPTDYQQSVRVSRSCWSLGSTSILKFTRTYYSAESIRANDEDFNQRIILQGPEARSSSVCCYKIYIDTFTTRTLIHSGANDGDIALG